MNAHTLGLHPVYKPRDPSRRYVGIAIVLVFHALILYGIITGTARNALMAAKKSLEAVVIQEVIIPPPPPPPPKEIKPPEPLAPKSEAPPPPFIPPPDVAPQTTSAPSIASVATPPPTPAVIAPPPPPPAPVHTGPTRSDMRVACPTQVPPEMPRKALQDGTEGVVKAQALIKDGVVQEVTILSGPRVFHAAVRAAMLQYKCVSGTAEVLATQEFAFRIE
ncbi:MAG: energy transducer TonB [Rhodoferax sp.]